MKRKLDYEEERGWNTMVEMRRLHGDGNLWVRGSKIGEGGYGSIFMANLKRPFSRFSCFPPIMAVKSAEMSKSLTLQNEKEALFDLRGCPYIIRCYGEETTMGDDGSMVYNLLLEYASGGTLTSLIKKTGILPDSDVKRYAKSLLKGLKHIHDCGYVHCDLKPDNVLLVPCSSSAAKFVPKIADFGLAQSYAMRRDWKRRNVGGTPRYMSPEVVKKGLQEAPSDIWGLGCVVLEMLTGRPVWSHREDVKGAEDILGLIDSNTDEPDIPLDLSKDAKDFIVSCLSWCGDYRWTAEMLLNHPFVATLGDDGDNEPVDEGFSISVLDSEVSDPSKDNKPVDEGFESSVLDTEVPDQGEDNKPVDEGFGSSVLDSEVPDQGEDSESVAEGFEISVLGSEVSDQSEDDEPGDDGFGSCLLDYELPGQSSISHSISNIVAIWEWSP